MVTASLLLGAALAKSVFKIWLKDNEIAGDMSAQISDIVQDRVAGRMEQRRIVRLFEDMEERAADTILSAVPHEYQSLPDNEKQAAIFSAAETFDRANLAVEDVLAADLDAVYLAKIVRAGDGNATRDLSASGAEFYSQVVNRCCAYIVACSNSLPGFEVGAFGELLSRQKEVLKKLESLDSMFQNANNPGGASFFESAYRQLLATKLDRVELFGFNLSEDVRSYPLSASYVNLSARIAVESEALSDDNDSFDGTQHDMAGTPFPEQINDTLSSVVSKSLRLLVRGEAGTGKTTLLQWVAVQAARRSFTGILRDLNGLTPFFVQLRRYVGIALPAPEAFLQATGRHIAEEMPQGWVQSVLRNGTGLLLIDGIDELPKKERSDVREWLIELLSAFPRVRVIVTSRPAAANSSWMHDAGFNAADIKPMNLGTAKLLIEYWHNALKSSTVDSNRVSSIELAEAALLKAIGERRHLRDLASTPLLTAMLCALNLDRRMQLPSDRTELYAVAVEALVERRDAERQIDGAHDISRAEKMLILSHVAYWMLRNGIVHAEVSRVAGLMERKLVNMPRVSGDAVAIISQLLNRSGVLREDIPGTINFIHRSFQEYFAAREVVDSDDIQSLILHSGEDTWRDVIIMASALAMSRQREELFRGLLLFAESHPEDAHRIQALTVACLHTAPILSSELSSRVQSVATKLIPSRTISDAMALSGAGEMVLELIQPDSVRTVQSAASTVRLAGQIGGDHALSVIEQLCVRHNSPLMLDELCTAWSRFDPHAYARRVLARAQRGRGSQRITLDDPSLVPALAELPLLRSLGLDFRNGHGDLSFLKDLENLESLEVVSDPALSKLNALQGLRRLRQLRLLHMAETSLLPLEQTAVTDLDIDADNCEFPIIDLLELSKLKKLHFMNPQMLQKAVPNLSSIARYDRLGFWRDESIASLPVLDVPALEQLKFLMLGDAPNLKSLDGIQIWRETLTGLYIHGSTISDLSHLASLPHVDFINLRDVLVDDFEFTRYLPKLRILHVAVGETVPDLSPLAALENLEAVYLRKPRGGAELGQSEQNFRLSVNARVVWHGAARPRLGA